MARQNMSKTAVKPVAAELLTAHVVRRERVSPNFARITLGGDDLAGFTPMGFDQWFRLFLPVSDESLSRVPARLTTLAFLKFLTTSKAHRAVLRNYSVRAFRADAGELDVDVVLHGSPDDGTAGPASSWAQTCSPGDAVGLLDEGIGFNPDPSIREVRLVADESGLPAAAGILASLPSDARGHALLEIPSEEDRQDVTAPEGVTVEWLVRTGHGVPGALALEAATALTVPPNPFYGWVVGESALPTALRRHWLAGGAPKENVMFCGYWKHSGR
ncbi:siderophore-interacting protein [Actinocorallia sp. A-T 12471]|uniref:siderophore-interacting protein n=1 Tax=Actinocorallia sp. A-T 12471 TaxID=3089813 RepID=UPI0029D2206E|nr:siderophore-interacting protein [Actinocorallia sp. A-T 12471]MDX6744853.1 siderophore-interacting protein [Actinocorallia sp. A-T 12471]